MPGTHSAPRNFPEPETIEWQVFFEFCSSSRHRRPAVTDPKTARMFLALWPDPDLRAALAARAAWLRQSMAGRWTRPENLHVTLVFLGDVDAERRETVRRIAGEIEASGFCLVFDQAQFWPRNGIVALAPAATPPALTELAGCLSERLRAEGFALERRSFRPHLTLARKGSATETRIALPEPVVWDAAEFCLVESRSGPEGSDYRVAATWPLRK
jgi:2'-5' RNA ligase